MQVTKQVQALAVNALAARTGRLRRALTATAARATALVWSGQVKGGWIITLSLAVEGRVTFQIAVISLSV